MYCPLPDGLLPASVSLQEARKGLFIGDEGACTGVNHEGSDDDDDSRGA